MRSDKMATLIGATFGLAYMLVNAGALPNVVAVVLRVGAALVYVGVGVMLHRLTAPPDSTAFAARQGFGRGYWLIVAGEVAAYVAGLFIIRALLDSPRAPLAWLTFIVGVHFFGLAAVWKLGFFRWLGGIIALSGAVGLGLAVATTSDAAVAVAAGVLPGAILLIASFRIGLVNPARAARRLS